MSRFTCAFVMASPPLKSDVEVAGETQLVALGVMLEGSDVSRSRVVGTKWIQYDLLNGENKL